MCDDKGYGYRGEWNRKYGKEWAPETNFKKSTQGIANKKWYLDPFILGVCGINIFLVNYFHLFIWWTVPGIIISFIHTAVFVFITPHIRWKRWRYEIREKEIKLSCGVFIIKRTLVPMVHVQHVDTEQGPLLKKFGLASIAVSTAANVHRIPAIDIHEADKVRHSIAVMARMKEEDV